MEVNVIQMVAARSALGWSQLELAERASLGASTVRDFEKGRRTPHPNNVQAIRLTLEAAGVAFLEDDGTGPGVRFKPKETTDD